MNNKGFMMAEVVVVSSIILVFLAGLYMSYNKVFSVYQDRVRYYDSSTLYDLAYYRDCLIKEPFGNSIGNDSKMNILLNRTQYFYRILGSEPYQVKKLNYGNDNYSETVYLVHNLKQKVDVSRLALTNVDVTFKEYIDYLSTSVDFKSNYIMLMERCAKEELNTSSSSSKMTGKTKCRYAYLEVYDGKE